jgi:hypothetical protein
MAPPPLIPILATAMLLPPAGQSGLANNDLIRRIDDAAIHASVRPRLRKKIDRFSQIALAATDGMIAALGDTARERVGVFVGNDLAGWNYVDEQLSEMIATRNPAAIDPYVATAWFPAAAQGEITIAYSILGPGKTFSAGALSGGLALENAAQLIAEEKIDMAIAGGVEAPDSPVLLQALAAGGQISTGYPAAEATGMMILGAGAGNERCPRLSVSRPRRSIEAAIDDVASHLDRHQEIGCRTAPYGRSGGGDSKILRLMLTAAAQAFGSRLQVAGSDFGGADLGSAAFPIAIIEGEAQAARRPSLVLGTDFEGLFLASAVLPPEGRP